MFVWRCIRSWSSIDLIYDIFHASRNAVKIRPISGFPISQIFYTTTLTGFKIFPNSNPVTHVPSYWVSSVMQCKMARAYPMSSITCKALFFWRLLWLKKMQKVKKCTKFIPKKDRRRIPFSIKNLVNAGSVWIQGWARSSRHVLLMSNRLEKTSLVYHIVYNFELELSVLNEIF